MTYNVFSGTLNPTHLLTYFCLLEMQGTKIVKKIAICAPLYNFIGLYLSN